MAATEWGVVYRVLDDDVEHALLRLHIMDVPIEVDKPQIKKALERAGRTYGEGRYLWGNHSVLPHDRWPLMYMGQSDEPAEEITYADLLDEGNGERRVTLRLPVGLHAALVKSASGASASLNQFCLQALAAAVTYDLSPAPAGNLAEVSGMLGITEEALAEIIRHAPPEVREQTLEASKALSGLPPERAKNRTLAYYNQAGAQVAEQAEKMDAFSDDEWEAMAVKCGLPDSGPDLKAEHERHKASRPEFLAHMRRMFEQKAETLRNLPADEVKSISLASCDVLVADADDALSRRLQWPLSDGPAAVNEICEN